MPAGWAAWGGGGDKKAASAAHPTLSSPCGGGGPRCVQLECQAGGQALKKGQGEVSSVQPNFFLPTSLCQVASVLCPRRLKKGFDGSMFPCIQRKHVQNAAPV